MAETYSHFLVTVDEVGGGATAEHLNGTVTAVSVAQSGTYQFKSVVLDTTGNILYGVQSDGTTVYFEPGLELSISLVNA